MGGLDMLLYRFFAIILVTALGACLLPGTPVQAKSCSSDDIIALAKQGFSKADIAKLCEGSPAAPSGATMQDADDLTAIIQGFFAASDLAQFESKTLAPRGVQLIQWDPDRKGHLSSGYEIHLRNSNNCITGSRGENYERIEGSGTGRSCILTFKRFATARSAEAQADCARLQSILRMQPGLSSGLTLWNSIAAWSNEDTEANGWRSYVAKTAEGRVVEVSCNEGGFDKRERRETGSNVSLTLIWM